MANNRMYLVYRPTGDCVYLGKRMGWGWYDTPDDVADRIRKLFEKVEAIKRDTCSQDDFAIALQAGKHQPHVIHDWSFIWQRGGFVSDKITIDEHVPYGESEVI